MSQSYGDNPWNLPARRDARSAALARNWAALALRGVFGIVFGLIALFWTGAALLSLAIVFAAYLLADGVVALVAAVRAAQHHRRWGALLAEAGLTIAMGVLAAIFPASFVVAFVLVLGAWALITGGLMLVAAFELHASHGRLWLALGGLVSLVWGGLLLVSPLIGAVVLTWWVGAYALVFGIALLVFALRLRQHAA